MADYHGYEPVIGLEIHVQLKTATKLFCASPNDFANSEPNQNICEVCTAQPGALPKLNRDALRKSILVGLALNCHTATITKFDRKNYFYPDLPKGYQISQYDYPVNGAGYVTVGERRIGITRAHLEEDAGKLMHSDDKKESWVDYNRAGVPLLEIVTDPDFQTPQEAGIFLRQLRSIVRYLDASDADMEKGHLRVDANVSVRKVGQTELPNYKVEIKNVNSFKAVEAALEYEISRQIEMLEKGEQPIDETRGFVDATRVTVSQRVKEAAHDYRYFPDPDLPPLEIPDSLIEELRRNLPELPGQKLERFVSEYGLPEGDVSQIIEDKPTAGYFENVASELAAWFEAEKIEEREYKKALKSAANWILGDIAALLNRDNAVIAETRITPENLAELVKLIEQGKISNNAGKAVVSEMYATGADPSEIIDRLDLAQVSDESAIEAAADKVITENPDVVEKYKSGKVQVIGVLVGQVMKEMKGKANPQAANEVLKKKLDQ